MLHQKEQAEFPWHGNYPIKTRDKAGNYADSAWHEKSPAQPFIDGYTDGFATTAPVMSFESNKHGLYDMGGNVWEMVDDWWNAGQQEKLVRGASFIVNDRRLLLSSARRQVPPDIRTFDHYGFRVVVEMTAL